MLLRIPGNLFKKNLMSEKLNVKKNRVAEPEKYCDTEKIYSQRRGTPFTVAVYRITKQTTRCSPTVYTNNQSRAKLT